MASPKFLSSLYLTGYWSKLLFAVYKPRYNAEYYRRLLANEEALKNTVARRGDLSLLNKLDNFKEDVNEMLSLNKKENTTNEDKQTLWTQEEKVMSKVLAIPNKIHKSVADTENVVDVIKPRNKSDMPTKMLDYIKLSYINGCMYKSIVGPNSQYFFGLGAKLQLAILDYFSAQLETKLNFDHFSGLCIVKSAVVEAVNSYEDKRFQDDCCRIKENPPALPDNVGEHVVETSRESCAAFVSRCHLNKSINTPLRLMSSGASYSSNHETDDKQIVKQADIVYCMSLTSSKEKDSTLEFLSLRNLIWDCYRQLAIPSRIVHCGAPQLKSNEYDSYRVDTWLPSKGTWIPVARVSNYLDYITTRINMKRGHIIDATLVDSNVLVMSIIENNQEASGRFNIPACLKKHTIGVTEAEERDYFKCSVTKSLLHTASTTSSTPLYNYTSRRYYNSHPGRRSLMAHSERFKKNMHPPGYHTVLALTGFSLLVMMVDKKKFYDNLPVFVQKFLYNYVLRFVIRPVNWFFREPVKALRPENDYYDAYVQRQKELQEEKELQEAAAKARRYGL